MPVLGLGVFQVEPGAETERAVGWALDEGYRRIDTASLYGNERSVGNAVRASGIPRSDVFVTSKVWNDEQGHEETLAAFHRSLDRLGFDQIDLYLVHWPRLSTMEATWAALEEIQAKGLARAVGVSNFLPHHLERLWQFATVLPVVDQCEFHPHLQQPELQAACRERDVRLEAWSPLKRGRILDDPVLVDVARRYGKTAAQVVLRWIVQKGVLVIPRSVRRERIIENAGVFDFELTAADMVGIDAMDLGERIGPDPDVFPN